MLVHQRVIKQNGKIIQNPWIQKKNDLGPRPTAYPEEKSQRPEQLRGVFRRVDAAVR